MKGIEYLIANKLVERNPASVAQFLRSTSSLKKVGQSYCAEFMFSIYRWDNHSYV